MPRKAGAEAPLLAEGVRNRFAQTDHVGAIVESITESGEKGGALVRSFEKRPARRRTERGDHRPHGAIQELHPAIGKGRGEQCDHLLIARIRLLANNPEWIGLEVSGLTELFDEFVQPLHDGGRRPRIHSSRSTPRRGRSTLTGRKQGGLVR